MNGTILISKEKAPTRGDQGGLVAHDEETTLNEGP
jgi:hypothetical protein